MKISRWAWQEINKADLARSRLAHIPDPKWIRIPRLLRAEKRALARADRRKSEHGRPKGVAARTIESVRAKVVAISEMSERVRLYKEKIDALRRWWTHRLHKKEVYAD